MSNSILSRLSGLATVTADAGKTRMTEEQVAKCKAKIRELKLGYNVQPNSFDVNTPYRVAINYNGEWENFGNFTSRDVAAAVGAIVSVAYFGVEKAKKGEFDEAAAENHEEFSAWLSDSRNQEVLSRASGDLPTIHQPKVVQASATEDDIVF